MHCVRKCMTRFPSQTPGRIEEKDDKALRRAIRLFLLLGLGTLDLGSAAEGLLAVLALLALLARSLLDLGSKADTDKTVVGLELLHGLGGIIDEGEASGLAATELGAETEDVDLVLGGLVEGGQLLAELVLGDVRTVGVEDIPVIVKKAGVSKTVLKLLREQQPRI